MSEVSTVTLGEPLQIGDRILDRYRIVERITSGGHSIVYRGDDERLSRPVCVKVFQKLGERTGVWRTSYEHFIQEAFALSKLTHPNTLRIYDFGHLEDAATNQGDGDDDDTTGSPFQVSEFMNGGTLSAVVRTEGPFQGPEAVKIVTALCGALAEAHQCGIVHRDIKPKNILFRQAGPERIAKLADFGIAKSRPVSHDEMVYRASDTNIIAGGPLLMFSPSWAAPEQMTGDPVEAHADIYSLALVIIYMLTGRVAFASNDPETAYKMRTQSDLAIDDIFKLTKVPRPTVELLKRACALRPDDRPPTVQVFGDAFAASYAIARRQAPPLAAVPPAPPKPGQAQPSDDAPSSAAGPPIPLRVADGAHPVGDRWAYFVPAPQGVADVTGGRGAARLRVTMLPTSGKGFVVHVKGLNCFVARRGGRPSPAVQLLESGAVDLVLPNHSVIARADVSFGSPAAGHTVFAVGDRAVAVSLEECPRVICADFGPGAECLLIYHPPIAHDAASPGAPRRRKKSTTRTP